MAILTKRVISFENGACFWEYDYDDVALRLIEVRCTNNGQWPTRGTFTVLSTGRTFSALVASGNGTLRQTLPSQQQQRLDITVDSRGRVDGIDHTIIYGPQVT